MKTPAMMLHTKRFEAARGYLETASRPLERARFGYEFSNAPADSVVSALEPFRNRDGGFGHGLEPDLWMPSSSVLCTVEALHILSDLAVSIDHEYVTAAVDWLVGAFDPQLGAWRQITEDAGSYPHAPWWNWELHADGTQWPVGVLPRAEVLAHLWRSEDRVPGDLLEGQTHRLLEDLTTGEDLGADSVARCECFVRSTNAPKEARDALTHRMLELSDDLVCRDSEEWSGYAAKPLKLAPSPDCVLAQPLAAAIEENLDWEIVHQEADGSWTPNWTWGGAYPKAWEEAERWWRGEVTLKTLRMFRAYGRLTQ